MKKVLKKMFTKIDTTTLIITAIISMFTLIGILTSATKKIVTVSELPNRIDKVENKVNVVENKYDSLSFRVCNVEKTTSKLDSLPCKVSNMEGKLDVIITILKNK